MTDISETIARRVADHTIGFLRLTEDHDGKNAVPAGTGTLVQIDDMRGILTAAHVLTDLPNEGLVGLVRFLDKEEQHQQLKLDMGKTQKILLGSAPFTEWGPDVAFLRMPFDTAGTLGATNTYVNFIKTREGPSQLGPRYFDAVVGEIGEWTEDLSPKRADTRLKGVRALFATGNIVRTFDRDGLDYFDLELVHETGFTPPNSYGGMSGGGLWRCYIDEALPPTILHAVRLHGVAFWQNDLDETVRVIRCHGPKSVYGALYDKIA